ncbi:MAG: site-2 protease family protein [Proteobacteria bacterium]|nr:site-2 protease family protein [Pseudomonadota bacterium]
MGDTGEIGAIVYTVTTWLLPVLFAITLHEAAHGYIAWKLGDDTAYRLGRVSFNPLRHIDRFGTIILPALLLLIRAPFLFGWAKPVPVNFRRLNNPRRDMILVAAAGPGINMVMAIGAAILLHGAVLLPAEIGVWTVENLKNALLINVVLAVFNMLPLPPLDGGRVAVGLLPPVLARPLAKIERWGLFIILGALIILPMIGRRLGLEIDLFETLVLGPVVWIIGIILRLTGH